MGAFSILWVWNRLCGRFRVLEHEGVLARRLEAVEDVDEFINVFSCWIFRRSWWWDMD